MAATDQAIPQAIMPPGFYVCVCIRHPLKTASLNYRCTEKAASLALTYDCKTSMFRTKKTHLHILGMKWRTKRKFEGRNNILSGWQLLLACAAIISNVGPYKVKIF